MAWTSRSMTHPLQPALKRLSSLLRRSLDVRSRPGAPSTLARWLVKGSDDVQLDARFAVYAVGRAAWTTTRKSVRRAISLRQEDLQSNLRQLLIENYGLDPSVASSIFNGDEAHVWKGTGRGQDFVVHLGPHWRRADELAWVHKVIRCAADAVSEAVGPMATRSGGTFAEYDGALVAVYPFIEGRSLDRTDEVELSEAGRVLGRIHSQLLKFEGGDRPPASQDSPQPRIAQGEPKELADPDLQRWHEDAAKQQWTTGVTHGDYYRRNLLCRKHKIVGIIDWHEARRAPLIGELAFAAWEMAHDDEMTFVPGAAKVFTDAYAESGPLESWEYQSLMPWMRMGLRDNIRYGLDSARLGAHSDPAYVAKQVEAFKALCEVSG